MEILSNVWIWIVTALSGLSVVGIVAAVVCAVVKGTISRQIQKYNLKKLYEELWEMQIDRIKKISFSQSIEPLAKSELLKVTEVADEKVAEKLEKVQVQYDHLINILEKFYAYFEDSLVSESKKADLKEALESAKVEVAKPTEIAIDEIIVEEPKQAVENKKEPRKSKIER